MRRFLTLIVLLSTVLACATPAAQPGGQQGGRPAEPTPGRPSELMTSPDSSVQVFLWGEAKTTERDLKLVKDAGFRWVKQMFQWNFVEGKGKGKYEWNEPDRIVEAVRKYDLKILARVDVTPDWARRPGAPKDKHGPPAKMQDYADYVGALAERYKGRIHAYQIWNEPNLAREWDDKPPNPAEFTEMLKLAYQAIKKADPNAVVINGGLSPTTAGLPLAMPDAQFLREMYKAGAKDFFDMYGVHAAGYRSAPAADPGDVAKDARATNNDPSPVDAKRVYAFRHVEDLRKIMVENGDEPKRVAVLEFGWTTDTRPGSPYAWFGIPEELKASYIRDAYVYAEKNWRPWIGVMSLIYLCAPHWTEKDEQYYWAITYEDGDTRVSYDTIKGYLTRK